MSYEIQTSSHLPDLSTLFRLFLSESDCRPSPFPSGMATLYPSYCERFGWMQEDTTLEAMKAKNAAKIAELDAKVADAVENLGDVEVREALLEKADFFASVGDRDAALAAYDACEQKTVAIGQKMEMVFSVMRLHIFTTTGLR